MGAPTVEDLGALLGKPITPEQGAIVLTIVTRAANSYTRGQGFDGMVPADDIAGVLLTSAARLLSNPSGLDRSESLGPQSASWRNSFQGFTVGELFTLNRYRARAA